MNQKELGELRRRLRPNKNAIGHVYGCYVSPTKEIIAEVDQSLSLLNEDDVESRLALLRKALSGGLGRNLIDIEFTTRQVAEGEEHKLLRALRDTKLRDEAVMIDSMLKFQDESGLWYQLPALGGKEPNYLETSGSAIMAYSLLKGVRLGFLPESYREYGLKAFNGICDKYLKEKDGHLSLGGICLVAGLGPEKNTRRDGSFEYYMSEPIVEDDAKGVGPLLLAYTEMRRLAD